MLAGLLCSACFAQSVEDDLFLDNLNEVIIENENARQLRIYSDALMQGVSDTIRLDAAMGLLIRKDQSARDVLLEAISAKENALARMAVCRALIKGRSLGAAVGSLDAFLLPLIETLKSTDPALARLGAEALLVYRFDQVTGPLIELVNTSTNEKQARISGIYALQLRTEPEALRHLIQLLNDTDPEVVRGAELALQESFGVPVGTSKQVWEKILQELNQKDPDEIRRERLLRQETRLREIQAERDRWQKLFLAALDKEFELIETAGKTAYILDKLSSELPAIRLWALDKVQRFQTDAAAGLREKLLMMLSDENRQVRLATAKVWSMMSALNPAERL
ncbi:MAG: HEAT repeat domain-containing protein, partial [Anaerohalosphaeraceae bacterium]